MRIISKFHDFYDSVQRQGMDKEVVYVRERKEILINQGDFRVDRSGSTNTTIEAFYLGFCGQIYKVYYFKNIKKNITVFYYDYEAFKNDTLSMGATDKYDFSRSWWTRSYAKFEDKNTDALLEIFHEYQVPVFMIRHSSERASNLLVLNPSLRDLKFHVVRDTYTTYQDIFQYVAGVLNCKENEMVKISDKDKIAKHGMDKWSFRKMPTKKK